MPTPHSQPDRHTGRRAVMLAVAALVLLGRRRAADPAFFAPAPALPQEPTPGLVPVRTRAQRSRARRLLTVVSAGAVAAAVALFLGASSAPATVDWQSGFEQTLSPWQDLQYQTDKPQADSFNFVTSPVRTGSYAAQFVARQGYGPYGGERTELCCGPSGEGAPGSEHWWAWSTYFSPDWSEPYKWGMFFQLHAGDDMPPAIAFDAGADAVWVDIRAGQVDPTNVTWSYGNFPQILSTLSKGQWNDFVLHVRWSLTDGQVEVWHRLGGNGGFSEVLNVDHIPTLQQYANGSVPGIYTKLGIYRDSYCSNPAPGCTSSLGVQPADTLYDDNFVRGSSFDDVVNAAWGSGSAPATAPSAPASAPPPTTTTTVEPPPATTTTADTTTTDTTTTTTTTTSHDGDGAHDDDGGHDRRDAGGAGHDVRADDDRRGAGGTAARDDDGEVRAAVLDGCGRREGTGDREERDRVGRRRARQRREDVARLAQGGGRPEGEGARGEGDARPQAGPRLRDDRQDRGRERAALHAEGQGPAGEGAPLLPRRRP